MSHAPSSSQRGLSLTARNALLDLLRADLAVPGHDGVVRSALHGAAVPEAVTDDERPIAHEMLRRYAAALEDAPRGDDRPTRLAQARVLFAHRLFFEVHEVLEPLWRDAAGDERRLLQGIIQAAVAWHHGARGRATPARRAAASAEAKLAVVPPGWIGFPVARLRELLGSYLRDLERGDPPSPPHVRL